MLYKLTIAAGDNCCIEYRLPIYLRALKLVILADYICQVSSTSEGIVDDVWDKPVLFIHLVCELDSSIPDHITGDEVFFQRFHLFLLY